MNCEHGGNIYEHEVTYDFSANLNPLGMPQSVINAAIAAVSKSDAYPDPECRELVKKLAAYESVDEKNIVCGNGADDIIYRIIHALKPQKALIAVPTFSEYEKALREVHCDVIGHSLCESTGFSLDESISGNLTDNVDMLILCNPNNPTGRLIDRELMSVLCKKSVEKNILFVCDECFIDLAENGKGYSAANFMSDNIIIVKAFTKTFAMAGLRLGYALFGDQDTAKKVRCTGQFWSVSSPAQAAGIAALDEAQYVGTARKTISEERKFLSEMLTEYGFKVYPSDANFILFRSGSPLDEMLIKEKILIRSCANYAGLGDGYFRIAVRSHDENKALAAAIGKVIKQQKP